jgi:hypothetical protein
MEAGVHMAFIPRRARRREGVIVPPESVSIPAFRDP